MKTTASVETLEKALAKINRKYAGNISFAHILPVGKRVDFTLTVKSSKAPGSRRGFSGKRVAAACWHAHGDLFDAIFAIDPTAKVISRGGPGAVITKDGGNWQDCNIGSQMQPLMYSQACDCA